MRRTADALAHSSPRPEGTATGVQPCPDHGGRCNGVAAILALGSALSFGVADFLGGLAARRAHPLVITLLAQAAGGALVVALAPLVGGEITTRAFVVGGLVGLAGALALVAYFHALATGPMGVTAPVAAIAGAVVPVSVGLALGERPGTAAVAGMALGIVAAVLVSLPVGDVALTRTVRRAAVWALVGGVGFGLFFVGLDQTPEGSGLWPLVGARLVSVPLLAVLVIAGPGLPAADVPWRTGIVSGALDMVANTLFLLAARIGLLSVTSVLASLYPAVVALLAAVLLRERLSPPQRAGVAVGLTAVALLAV